MSIKCFEIVFGADVGVIAMRFSCEMTKKNDIFKELGVRLTPRTSTSGNLLRSHRGQPIQLNRVSAL